MRLTLTIDCENAAFEDNAGPETARILRELADKLADFPDMLAGSIPVYDINGNRVGECRVS